MDSTCSKIIFYYYVKHILPRYILGSTYNTVFFLVFFAENSHYKVNKPPSTPYEYRNKQSIRKT